MRLEHKAFLLSGLLLGSTACRILSMDVACRADRDCPERLPVCEGSLDDGGVGACGEATDGGLLGGEDAGDHADAFAPTNDGGGRGSADAGEGS